MQNCTYGVSGQIKWKIETFAKEIFFVIIKAERNELFIFLGPKKKKKKLKIAISLRRRIAHKGESISPRFYKFMQFSLFQTHSDSFAFSFNLQASPRQEGMSRNRDTVRKKKESETEKKELNELSYTEIVKSLLQLDAAVRLLYEIGSSRS